MDAGLLRPRIVSVHHRPPTARFVPRSNAALSVERQGKSA